MVKIGSKSNSILVIFAVGWSLASCDSGADKFEARENRIARALAGNEDVSVLGSKAVWLVKISSLAPRDRTAVFFGYGDNLVACQEFVAAYEVLPESAEYRCEQMES